MEKSSQYLTSAMISVAMGNFKSIGETLKKIYQDISKMDFEDVDLGALENSTLGELLECLLFDESAF